MGSQYTSTQLLPLSAEKPYALTAVHLEIDKSTQVSQQISKVMKMSSHQDQDCKRFCLRKSNTGCTEREEEPVEYSEPFSCHHC